MKEGRLRSNSRALGSPLRSLSIQRSIRRAGIVGSSSLFLPASYSSAVNGESDSALSRASVLAVNSDLWYILRVRTYLDRRYDALRDWIQVFET
jgi:hypothetical protein